jgi:hypothetical protein
MQTLVNSVSEVPLCYISLHSVIFANTLAPRSAFGNRLEDCQMFKHVIHPPAVSRLTRAAVRPQRLRV